MPISSSNLRRILLNHPIMLPVANLHQNLFIRTRKISFDQFTSAQFFGVTIKSRISISDPPSIYYPDKLSLLIIN